MTTHFAWWQLLLIVSLPVISGILLLRGVISVVLWRRRPKLTIYSAMYGTGPDDDDDKTGILQKHNREGLVFDVNNLTLGGDPAFGKLKRLEVEYSFGNKYRKKTTCQEGKRLILPETTMENR